MDMESMPKPVPSYPAVAVLSIVVTYGALLAVLASSAASKWSGQASLAMAYLLLVAPFVMGTVAYQQRHIRHDSLPHRKAFYAALLYLVLLAVFLAAAFAWQQYTKS